MNFFEQLAATGNVDLTIRIMQKNDKLTLNVMPGNSISHIMPIVFTGTPAELDEGFFATIIPGVKEVEGLVSNLDSVKEGVKKAEASESAPAKRKTEAKPSPKKTVKAKPEKKVVEETAPLFED